MGGSAWWLSDGKICAVVYVKNDASVNIYQPVAVARYGSGPPQCLEPPGGRDADALPPGHETEISFEWPAGGTTDDEREPVTVSVEFRDIANRAWRCDAHGLTRDTRDARLAHVSEGNDRVSPRGHKFQRPHVVHECLGRSPPCQPRRRPLGVRPARELPCRRSRHRAAEHPERRRATPRLRGQAPRQQRRRGRFVRPGEPTR
jgi:hypothetical protein